MLSPEEERSGTGLLDFGVRIADCCVGNLEPKIYHINLCRILFCTAASKVPAQIFGLRMSTQLLKIRKHIRQRTKNKSQFDTCFQHS